MSQHLWLKKSVADETLDKAVYAVELAQLSGLLDVNDILCWVGYLLESVLQKGYGKRESHDRAKPGPGRTGPHRYSRTGKVFYSEVFHFTLNNVGAGAVKSGFKYSKGRNRQNYINGGLMVLSQVAPRFGWDAETVKTTPAAFIDHLQDLRTGDSAKYERLRAVTKYGLRHDLKTVVFDDN